MSRPCRNARDDVVMTFLRNANEAVGPDGNDPCNLVESLQRLQQLLEEGTRQTGLTRLVNGNIQGSIAKSEGDKLFTAFVKKLSDRLEIYFK